MVFEKVIEDQKVANQDIRDVKKDVGEMKLEMVSLKTTVEDIKTLLQQRRKPLLERIPILKDMPALFWILLIILVCASFSLLGANLDFLKNIKFGG